LWAFRQLVTARPAQVPLVTFEHLGELCLVGRCSWDAVAHVHRGRS
jgi:hypothetical protein